MSSEGQPVPTNPSLDGPHTIVRRDDRARYDADTVYAILDATPLCHIGFVHDDAPAIVPTLQVRIHDEIYVHGSHLTRMVRATRERLVCVTATMVDAWVLARSAFHHSTNYRSVVVYGHPREIDDLDRKRVVLDALVEKIVPGRGPTLRPTTDKELRATAVIGIPVEEASAKIRSGPPVDDAIDVELPIWAGLVPVAQVYGDPIPAPDLHEDATEPDHLGFFRS